MHKVLVNGLLIVSEYVGSLVSNNCETPLD